jgi:peptidoglycan/LPS O-acetylase OafA/YrhL
VGLLRLLLASAVVFGHGPGFAFQASVSPLGIRFLQPYYAVQAFFVISGFYMSLIIIEKYRGSAHWRSTFYINRYLRISHMPS